MYEDNDCEGAGTQCTNPDGANSITLTASEQAGIESDAVQTVETENNCAVGAECSIGATLGEINEIDIDAEDSSEVDADIHQVAYGENNCDPGATCDLKLDNTVQINAGENSKVNANIDVKLNGENNCESGETCDLKLRRTIIIVAKDGEEFDVNYKEDVNLKCDGGDSPCEDEKTIICTINGCAEETALNSGTRISRCY